MSLSLSLSLCPCLVVKVLICASNSHIHIQCQQYIMETLAASKQGLYMYVFWKYPTCVWRIFNMFKTPHQQNPMIKFKLHFTEPKWLHQRQTWYTKNKQDAIQKHWYVGMHDYHGTGIQYTPSVWLKLNSLVVVFKIEENVVYID